MSAGRPKSRTSASFPSDETESPARWHFDLRERTAALFRRLRRPATAVSLLYLALLIAVSVRYLLTSLSVSWFFSSDEYVFAGEVIRFLNLDVHQRFFDMPGTPFMLLSAILWYAFYAVQTWFVPDLSITDVTGFTYNHLDWFFNLLRSETIFFYAISLVLLFLVARRLMNRAGAFVACLLLMMSPIYASYSSFQRVESMAICLALSAMLVTYRTLERRPQRLDARPSWRDPMIFAGILLGVAAATRLHSISASIPLLFLILWFDQRTPRRREYPRWTLSLAPFLLPSIGVAGVLCWWWARSEVHEFPYAGALLTKAGIAIAVAPVALAILYRIRKTRPLLLRVASPAVLKIGLGCLGGFFLSNFTIFPQYRVFLDSMNRYSGSYIDWQRTTWPLWTNIRWYVDFYFKVFAPNTVVLVLLAASVVCIVAFRRWIFLPYLILFGEFFVSKPLNLIAAPHHTLLWLPPFAILCALPAAELYSFLARLAAGHPKWRFAVPCAMALLIAAISLLLTNGPREASRRMESTQVRLTRISQATDWIKSKTPWNTTIAMSYFCFNPDIFYAWLQSSGVPVPPSVLDRRGFFVWWGTRDQLQGMAGYACVTGGRAALLADKARVQTKDPSQLVDFFDDPAARQVAQFGNDANEVDLFRFDFRAPVAKKN
jgi:hypothetical protein